MPTDWSAKLKSFELHLTQQGKQKATIESYLLDATSFSAFIDRHRINPKDLEPSILLDFKDHLENELGISPNSIRRKIIGIRQYFRFLQQSGHLQSNPFEGTPIPKRLDIAAEVSPLGVVIAHLEQDTPSNFKEARDLLALSMLALEGVKVTELISLRWHQLLGASQNTSLKISGTKERVITLCSISAKHFARYREFWRAWQAEYRQGHSGLSDHILVGFKGRQASIVLERVTRHGIKHMIYEFGKFLQIEHLNTELLRHLSIEYHLNQGWKPEQIMDHLGLKRLGNISQHVRKSSSRSPHAEP